MISRKMVQQGQHDPTLVDSIVGNDHAQQRSLTHIQAVVPWIKTRTKLGPNVFSRVLEDNLFNLQLGLPQDNLNRFRQSLPKNRRAQNVVAVHNLLGRTNKTLNALNMHSNV